VSHVGCGGGSVVSSLAVLSNPTCDDSWLSDVVQETTGHVVTASSSYTGPTGPDWTKSADIIGDPGLVESGPCSGI